MGTHAGSVMTLANSIIGVSVLAMPFCFKQCGIVLSIVMLLASSIVSRLACHYLIKAAIMEKRRNFEMLAFRVFGPTGKLMVELCIIGFMLGTCVAYFVVVGDLGPAIMAPILGFEHPTALRPSVLIGLGVFVVLPLGLLRNVDSLSTLSAASIAFYSCLVLKVMGEATTHLLAWDWVDKVHYWRPAGFLQCIPIFSMALSCQTQLFEIFDSLPNTPLDRMNAVVKSAINMTTLFYIAVGFFGYIAYCNQSFTGNLMMNFSHTMTSDVIKIGFVLSVAVSFPLVIFPCRASLYSLLFSKGHTQPHELTGSAHIPETKFQCITLVIVTASLITGLLIPNIELVLGLVGSTIGVFICLVFPAVIFISLSTRNTNERLLAKILVAAGLTIMVLGTYTNLHATSEAVSGPEVKKSLELHLKQSHDTIALPQLPVLKEKVVIRDETLKGLKDVKELAALPELHKDHLPGNSLKDTIGNMQAQLNVRQEPPVPIDPEAKNIPVIADVKSSVKQDIESGPKEEKSEVENSIKFEQDKIVDKNKIMDEKKAELLEKLIEHEVIHKKFIDEGKKLLSEIEDSRKQGYEDSKVKKNDLNAVKIVNVKTGAVSNLKKLDPVNIDNVVIKNEPREVVEKKIESIKDNQNNVLVLSESVVKEKSDSALIKEVSSSKINNKSKGFKDEMVRNMVKGVPLPVAIKGNLQTNLSDVENKDVLELPKREILQEEKTEERGKRDLEEVEKFDLIQNSPFNSDDSSHFDSKHGQSIVDDGNPLKRIVSLDNSDTKEIVNYKDKNINTNEVIGHIIVKDSLVKNEPHIEYLEKGKQSFSEILVDAGIKEEEKGKKCIKESNPTVVNKTTDRLVTKENVSLEHGYKNIKENKIDIAELIRTPSYLSDPKPVLDGTVKIDESDPNILQEAGRPLKRDLKSVEPLKSSLYDTEKSNKE